MPARLLSFALIGVAALSALLTAAPVPPAPARRPPTLVQTAAYPPARPGRPCLFVFEGQCPTPMHRPGPEHFKLERVADGKRVPLTVAYERHHLDEDGPGGREKVMPARRLRAQLRYNTLFRGLRLHLDSGPFDAKDVALRKGQIDLYARARLELGTRYRLTWACWPVGAARPAEVSCDFEVGR